MFSAAGLIPTTRPSRAAIFSPVGLDYRLATNVLGLVVFVTLFGLTMRRGATDPICGMRVDRRVAIVRERDGRRQHFCSQACAERFAAGERDGAQSPACTAASPAHSP